MVKGMASSPVGLERGQTPGRLLVRCTPVGRQVPGEGLDHHPLAGRDRAQAGQLVGEEGAGVGVGQEAGLLQDEAARLGEVVHRGRVAVGGEPVARHRVAQLGPFAEGEERLVAARSAPGAGHREDLIGRQVGRGEASRGLGERAVAAAVPAQHRQRNEDLGREGDPAPVCAVTHDAGQLGQFGEWGAEEVGVGEHRGQSRWRQRPRRRPAATPSPGRAPGPPAGPRRAPARPPPPPGRRRPR